MHYVYRVPRSVRAPGSPADPDRGYAIPSARCSQAVPAQGGQRRRGWTGVDTDLTSRALQATPVSRSSSRDRCTLARTAPTTEGRWAARVATRGARRGGSAPGYLGRLEAPPDAHYRARWENPRERDGHPGGWTSPVGWIRRIWTDLARARVTDTIIAKTPAGKSAPPTRRRKVNGDEKRGDVSVAKNSFRFREIRRNWSPRPFPPFLFLSVFAPRKSALRRALGCESIIHSEYKFISNCGCYKIPHIR